MKRGTISTGLIVGGLACSALVATAAIAEERETKASLSKAVPAFDEAQTAEDRFPDFLASGEQAMSGVDPSTARSLGSDDDEVRYWSARNDKDEVCLVALLPGENQYASMTCGSPETLLQNGLGIQVSDDQVGVRAYMVPPDYTVAEEGYSEVTDQLFVGSSDGATEGPAARVPGGQPLSSDSAPAEIELPAFESQPAGFEAE